MPTGRKEGGRNRRHNVDITVAELRRLQWRRPESFYRPVYSPADESAGLERLEFANIKLAADAMGVRRNAIHQAMRTGGRCKGRHWKHAEVLKEVEVKDGASITQNQA